MKKNTIVSQEVYNSSLVGGNFTDKKGHVWQILGKKAEHVKGRNMLTLQLQRN